MSSTNERQAIFFNDQEVFADDLNFIGSAESVKRQETVTALMSRWGVVASDRSSTALAVSLIGSSAFSVGLGKAVDVYGRVINVPIRIDYSGSDPGFGTEGDRDYRPVGTLPSNYAIPLSTIPTGGLYINIAYSQVSGSYEYDDAGNAHPTRCYDSYVITQDETAGTGSKIPLARITNAGGGAKTVVDLRQLISCYADTSADGTLAEHRRLDHVNGLVGTTSNAAGVGSLGAQLAVGGVSIAINQIASGDLLYVNGVRFSAVEGSLTVSPTGSVGQTAFVYAESDGSSLTIKQVSTDGTAPTWAATQYPICSASIATGPTYTDVVDLRTYFSATSSIIRNVSLVSGSTVTDALNNEQASRQAENSVLAAALTAAKTDLGGTQLHVSGVSAATYWFIATLPATTTATYDKLMVELFGGGWESSFLAADTFVFANRQEFIYGAGRRGRRNTDRSKLGIVAYRDGGEGGAVSIYAYKPAGVAWVSGIVRARGINVGNSLTYAGITIGSVTTTSPTGTKVFDSCDEAIYPSNLLDTGLDLRFEPGVTGHTHNGAYPQGPQLDASVALVDESITSAKYAAASVTPPSLYFYGQYGAVSTSGKTVGNGGTIVGTTFQPGSDSDPSHAYLVLVGFYGVGTQPNRASYYRVHYDGVWTGIEWAEYRSDYSEQHGFSATGFLVAYGGSLRSLDLIFSHSDPGTYTAYIAGATLWYVVLGRV